MIDSSRTSPLLPPPENFFVLYRLGLSFIVSFIVQFVRGKVVFEEKERFGDDDARDE